MILFLILAESPNEVIRAFGYLLGKVHLLNAIEDHSVNLDGVRANKKWARKRSQG